MGCEQRATAYYHRCCARLEPPGAYRHSDAARCEKRLGPRGHWFAALLVFIGSWLSGYFIVVTDAWMQHPVGYQVMPNGTVQLSSFSAHLGNPWSMWQYLHTIGGAAITGSVVMASVGAFYVLSKRATAYGHIFLKVGVIAGCVFSIVQLFPTGDQLGGIAFGMYPTLLPATTGSQYSLTVDNSAAGAYGLRGGIVWWTASAVLVVGYFCYVYWMFRQRVNAADTRTY